MAAAAVQGEQLDKMLQCSICIDVFTDPRTLPCLHTFCYKCIADWCKDKQRKGKVSCPECREEFVIPDSGIDGLKKNFFIARMLSMNKVEQKTGDLCEICVGVNKNVSEMFCLQCEQSYCESCSKAHLRTNNCKLVRLDELQSGVDVNKKYRQQYCDKHSEELIKMYCLDDGVAICMMCCVLDHRSHRCKKIKNVANQFRSGKWKQDLQTALRDVEEKCGVLNLKKITFFNKIKMVENEICEEADKKIQLIMNHRRKLISSLQNIKTHNEREIDKVNQELNRTKALLSTFRDYCDELLNKGSDVNICQEKNSLCKKTEELVNMEELEDCLRKLIVTNVIFSSSSATFEDKSALGELKADEYAVFSEHKSMSTLTPAVTPTVKDNLQLLSTLNQRPTDKNGDPCEVTGVAMLDNYLCVVYCDCDTVKVFSCEERFKKIKTIQVNGMNSPCDMVGCSVTSQLFVSGNGNIWRVNVNTEVSDVFIKLCCYNARLLLAENRLLVTSSWDSLFMYDIHSGQRMKNIPYTEDMKKYEVLHAIESNRDSFFVCHQQSYSRKVK